MTDDPQQLRELARWFAAAAHNTSDPRLKADMAARARELLEEASAFSRPRPARVVVSAPIE